VRNEFDREYEARARVEHLIGAAPGRWKDITNLVTKRNGYTSDGEGPGA
jgi:hypothetical protein